MRKFFLFSALALAACGRNDATTSPATGAGATMQVVAGDNDTSSVDAPITVVILVRDAAGRFVDGQLVNWVVTSGGGSTFVGVTSTDTGETANRWTLGLGDNTLEARAVDKYGDPLTFAVIHAFGKPAPRVVGWTVRMDGAIESSPQAFVTPASPYDMRQHLEFLLVDSVTNSIIPGAVLPPTILYYPEPGPHGCQITVPVTLDCTGIGYGFNDFPLNVYPPHSPGEGYRWREDLDVPNVPARFKNFATVTLTDARFYADFTVTCTARHSCTFDASSSKIALGVGTLGSYNWYFGDGYQGTQVRVVHDYSGPRAVDVRLIIYDSKLHSVRITKTVVVP